MIMNVKLVVARFWRCLYRSILCSNWKGIEKFGENFNREDKKQTIGNKKHKGKSMCGHSTLKLNDFVLSEGSTFMCMIWDYKRHMVEVVISLQFHFEPSSKLSETRLISKFVGLNATPKSNQNWTKLTLLYISIVYCSPKAD